MTNERKQNKYLKLGLKRETGKAEKNGNNI
jgi:hypothetical protein